MERDPIVDNGHNRRKARDVQLVIQGIVASQVRIELDGQTYQPSPQIIPDTVEGFDMNGDFHARPDGA